MLTFETFTCSGPSGMKENIDAGVVFAVSHCYKLYDLVVELGSAQYQDRPVKRKILHVIAFFFLVEGVVIIISRAEMVQYICGIILAYHPVRHSCNNGKY